MKIVDGEWAQSIEGSNASPPKETPFKHHVQLPETAHDSHVKWSQRDA